MSEVWRKPAELDPLYDAAQKAVAEVAEGVPPWLITVAVNATLAALGEPFTPSDYIECRGCGRVWFPGQPLEPHASDCPIGGPDLGVPLPLSDDEWTALAEAAGFDPDGGT